ncbi:unnamed protein product [Bathycoccus prasinos]|mmetsp:Transcript_3457/g.11701  ORF Transcript_3457/g.11701 Transcript_3457/m.11701 type:complete len:487 (+) Transcript_3457:211-1671(+)
MMRMMMMKMLMTRFNHHHRGAAKKATVTLLFSRKFVFKSGDNDDDDDVYESFSLDDPRMRNVLDDDASSGNFFIGHPEKNGRGLYASRDVTKNESIFKKKKKKKNDNNNNKAGGGTEGRQKPITSHPTIWNYDLECYLCLGELSKKKKNNNNNNNEEVSSDGRFCSVECERDARASFYETEQTMDLRRMEKYCEENELKFPLMALRIATRSVQRSFRLDANANANAKASVQFMVTQSMRKKLIKEINISEEEVNQMTPEEAARRIRENEEEEEEEQARTNKKEEGAMSIDRKTMKKYANVAELLVHAHVDEHQMFPSWKEEHALLLQTLESCEKIRDSEEEKAKIRSVFDIRWYADLTTRFHLNSFKVEYPVSASSSSSQGDFRAMMEQTLTSSIRTGASNGSAIYAYGSMFNHSCAPNVNVTWPERNHLVEFVANENIKQGEQLTIAYIDLNEDWSLNVAKRRAQLEEAYGFVCECPRCVSETQN